MIMISAIFFAALLPFAKVQLTRIPQFIVAYQSTLFFNTLLTAFYFSCQFIRLHSRRAFVMAMGFLYDALLTAAHTLSFPEVFSATGLLSANSQTTVWLYLFWHGGFPLFPVICSFLRDKDYTPNTTRRNFITLILGYISIIGIVTSLTLLVTTFIDFLPPVLNANNLYFTGSRYYVFLVWAIGITALSVLSLRLRRTSSVLDLWLVVVMSAWVFEVGLGALFNHGRYDLGFYAGRVYGLVAGGFILVMIIIDVTRFNQWLSAVSTELKVYSDSLETRVSERTEELTHIIEERHQLELQLVQSQKMTAIGNLTSDIAHDFNNLLSVIIGNLDMLRETPHDTETDEILRDVLNAALHGTDITKRLLEFARKPPDEVTVFNVNDLIENLFKLIGRALGKNINVSLQLTEVWPVKIGSSQLEDAIINLVTNARDAMPNGGDITITTSNQHIGDDLKLLSGDYVMIAVTDTGCGMPPEVMDHIFEPFFTTKDQGKGTGLGLSVVSRFIKGSGGHIRVVSQPGEGTTFYVYLPRAEVV